MRIRENHRGSRPRGLRWAPAGSLQTGIPGGCWNLLVVRVQVPGQRCARTSLQGQGDPSNMGSS